MKKKMLVTLLVGVLPCAGVSATGPFAPAAGQPGTTAISKDDPVIIDWASGWRDYVPGAEVDEVWRTPDKALGPAVGDSSDVVSLGRGGSITMTFNKPISNGPGADFSIFENSINDTFLELAWVEVSSDGSNFSRFSGVSFTDAPVNGFGNIDPTNVDGFAGKYRQGFGSPFDLQDLEDSDGLDINAINYIRLIDVVGDGSLVDDFPSDQGGPHVLYDPYPTIGSAGFDLDAVGVINAVPIPAAFWLFTSSLIGLGLFRKHR